jgi:hypothetical protein
MFFYKYHRCYAPANALFFTYVAAPGKILLDARKLGENGF